MDWWEHTQTHICAHTHTHACMHHLKIILSSDLMTRGYRYVGNEDGSRYGSLTLSLIMAPGSVTEHAPAADSGHAE